jgi:hypothetical protein
MYIQIAWNEPEGDEDTQAGTDAAAAAATAQAAAQDAPSPFRAGAEAAAGKVDVEEVAGLQPVRPVDTSGATDDGAPADIEGKTEEQIAAEAAAKAGKKGGESEEQAPPDDKGADEIDDDETFKANLAKEVDALAKEGVKPKALERFKAQAERIRTLETERPELERVAAEAVRWEESITSTGADPEQFGRVMGYLHAINKGSREDKMQARQALTDELKWIDQQLGIKGEHYNPLDEHADLKRKVETGEMDKADAEELAERRNADKLKADADAKTQTEQQRETEINTALTGIKAFGAEQAKKDPQFKAKLAYLAPTVELIQKNLPPAKWLGAIKDAMAKLPKLPTAAQPKPRVTAPTVRPGASTSTEPVITTKNAFSAGVEAARKTGR